MAKLDGRDRRRPSGREPIATPPHGRRYAFLGREGVHKGAI